MDTKWRNLGIILVLIVVVAALFFLVQGGGLSIQSIFGGKSSNTEQMYLEIYGVLQNTDVNVVDLRLMNYFDVDENGNILSYYEKKDSLLAAKKGLLDLGSKMDAKYAEDVAAEGKLITDTYAKAIDFMILNENTVKKTLSFRANASETDPCSNLSGIVDLNQMVADRSVQLQGLADNVMEYSLSYNLGEELVYINYDIQNAFADDFSETTNQFVDYCGGLNG